MSSSTSNKLDSFGFQGWNKKYSSVLVSEGTVNTLNKKTTKNKHKYDDRKVWGICHNTDMLLQDRNGHNVSAN